VNCPIIDVKSMEVSKWDDDQVVECGSCHAAKYPDVISRIQNYK